MLKILLVCCFSTFFYGQHAGLLRLFTVKIDFSFWSSYVNDMIIMKIRNVIPVIMHNKLPEVFHLSYYC